MNEKIIGFLILRKPESMETVEPAKKIFKIDGKYYSGIERSHLNDLEDFRKENLPNDLKDILKINFEESNTIFFPKSFIRKFEDAKKLFNYINKNNLNELIVISSDRIMKVKGYSEIDSKYIEWLGYDLCILQSDSLILAGLYFKPYLFSKWISILNEHGLFDSLDDCTNYFNDYLEAANSGEVEDYEVTEENSEPIKVGKIKS